MLESVLSPFFAMGKLFLLTICQTGPDGIFPEFLISQWSDQKKKLLHFIDVTREEDVPYHWKKAEIIHFLQEGKDYTATESYRPITITSVCCKLAERMVVHLLSKHTKTGSFQEK